MVRRRRPPPILACGEAASGRLPGTGHLQDDDPTKLARLPARPASPIPVIGSCLDLDSLNEALLRLFKPCFALGQSPLFRPHFQSRSTTIFRSPTTHTPLHSPPPTLPVLVLPLSPKSALGPATHLWFFSLVPSARPLSPVVGGEGSGRWHVVPRVHHASWMAGPGREFRGVTRFALPPTLPLALSPILPPWQGTLGGRFHLALFQKSACWSARTNSHFFERGVSHTARIDRSSEADAHFFASWSVRTNSHFFEGECRLIAADLWARPRSTHGFSCVGPHGPRPGFPCLRPDAP